jgi:polyhydroxyalkanoate synthesis regulator phasin
MGSKDGVQKLNKLFETGVSVAKMAQARAEEVLKDAAHISEMQRNQMKDLLEETARKSKQNTEVLIKSLRKEMERQIRSANLISREEVVKLSDKVSALSRELGKVSILKDEIAKLNEILSTLLKTVAKPGEESGSTSTNNDASSTASSDIDTSAQASKLENPTPSGARARTSTSSSSRKTAASSTRRASQPSASRRSRSTKSVEGEKSDDSDKSEPKPSSSD